MRKTIFAILVMCLFLAGCATEQKVGGDKDEHGCLLTAGYQWCEVTQKCQRFWDEPCQELTFEEALAIAKGSSCADEGEVLEKYDYNSDTRTWWFSMVIEKPGCLPACVVSERAKTAEINWRCTGLLVDEDENASAARETAMQHIMNHEEYMAAMGRNAWVSDISKGECDDCWNIEVIFYADKEGSVKESVAKVSLENDEVTGSVITIGEKELLPMEECQLKGGKAVEASAGTCPIGEENIGEIADMQPLSMCCVRAG
jgi:hypothetical protein